MIIARKSIRFVVILLLDETKFNKLWKTSIYQVNNRQMYFTAMAEEKRTGSHKSLYEKNFLLYSSAIGLIFSIIEEFDSVETRLINVNIGVKK